MLSKALVNRNFFRIELQNDSFSDKKIAQIKAAAKKQYSLTDEELPYFVFDESTSNYMYKPGVDKINILFKDGTVKDITEVSDQLNINMLSKPTTKFFLCYPKDLVFHD
jgi:hypothetical protein